MDFDKLVNNNGIYLYEDNNFNTISIKLNFYGGAGNRENVILDVLCVYLKLCNKNFNSDEEIKNRKKELYYLNLYFGNQFYGKQKIVSLSANLISPNVIDDDYSESAFEFIRQMLKEPDFTNQEVLELSKRRLLSYIKSNLSDNDVCARKMYYQNVLYEDNKEYENSVDIDYISNLINSITLDDLKKQYDYFINNFHSGLVFGNISLEQFNNFVNCISLTPINEYFNYKKRVSAKEGDIEIEKNCEQSYIYVTYDINNLTYPQLILLEKILNSSLGLCFQILREKYGLVYYSYACMMYYFKKIYFYGEIDKEKKEDFLKAVDEIIDILNNKDLLNKLISLAKEEIESGEVTLSEDRYRMINSIDDYLLKYFGVENRTEIYQQINKLTVDDLIKSTKTLKRKNVFMVRSKSDE
ncbi:MAG: insulinase family protein [Bacilli bacterium]|nr:insulinase family protein [Bacilli bacterium]